METEDARKKRDCPEEEAAEQPQTKGSQVEEKAKKFRANNDEAGLVVVAGSNKNNDESPAVPKSTTTPPKRLATAQEDSPSSEPAATTTTPPVVWDLETALHRLNGNEQGSSNKEFLFSDENASWVTFRWAHAGDASTLAAWYRQSEDQVSTQDDNNNSTTDKQSSSPGIDSYKKMPTTSAASSSENAEDPLELWLADGLGDEDTPPAVMALLAHLNSSTKSNDSNNGNSRLGAVALLTLAWEEEKRILRVEWCRVDPSFPEAELLARRLWLRLSALALMTACQTLVMEESTFMRFSGSSSKGDTTRTVVAGPIKEDGV